MRCRSWHACGLARPDTHIHGSRRPRPRAWRRTAAGRPTAHPGRRGVAPRHHAAALLCRRGRGLWPPSALGCWRGASARRPCRDAACIRSRAGRRQGLSRRCSCGSQALCVLWSVLRGLACSLETLEAGNKSPAVMLQGRVSGRERPPKLSLAVSFSGCHGCIAFH